MCLNDNAQRGEWAAYELDTYAIAKEGRADYDAPEDVAADMLCDLLHLISQHTDAETAKSKLQTALINFEAELAEEESSHDQSI